MCLLNCKVLRWPQTKWRSRGFSYHIVKGPYFHADDAELMFNIQQDLGACAVVQLMCHTLDNT